MWICIIRTDRVFICCTARGEAQNNIGAAINEVDVQVPYIKSIHRLVLTPSRWTGKLSDACLSHDRLLDSYRGYVHMQFGAFSFTMKVWSLVAGIGVQGIGVTLELKVRTSPCDVQLRLCEVLRDHPVARAVPAQIITEETSESFILICGWGFRCSVEGRKTAVTHIECAPFH